jgi:hypothetical protein
MSDSTENAKGNSNTVTHFADGLTGHCKYQFEKAMSLGYLPNEEAFNEQIWQCPICRRLYEYNAWSKTWNKIF